MIDARAGGKEVSAFMICDHRTIRRYGSWRRPPLPVTALSLMSAQVISRQAARSGELAIISRHRAPKISNGPSRRSIATPPQDEIKRAFNARGPTSSRRREFFAKPVHRRDIRRTVLRG